MGEEEVKEEVVFRTVSAYLKHLKEEGKEQAEVSVLEEILSRPASASGTRRGQLAGINIEDMSDEQLKREIVNANSVYYKAKQRGAADDIIERNKARVDAAIALREKRKAEAAPAEEAPTTDEATPVDEDLAAEL